MRVTFIQSGGFAGAIKHCTLDTETMGAEDARALEELIANADVSASREVRSRSGRDLEEYQISIATGDKRVTVVQDQSTLSPHLKALVGYLKKCARPGLPKKQD
jgi:hypothetical protein